MREHTGKTDYTAYLIASKQIGDFKLHGNAGFTVPGSPEGVDLQTTFNYAAAVEYRVNAQWDVVAEVFGSTSSLGGSETADGADAGTTTGAESTLTPAPTAKPSLEPAFATTSPTPPR